MNTLLLIHSFKISEERISGIDINSSGEWIAFGSRTLGQLFVWEWKTETYILKQQGHLYDVNTSAYSPNGLMIASGGDDGKVKVWDCKSQFCFVTFDSHTASVTGICFLGSSSNGLLSSSLDGTVRAWDLVRYRNFRIMTTPKNVGLYSVAVDHSGQIVCAGSWEPYEIYVWALKTGELLDVLSGHLGPVSSLIFSNIHVYIIYIYFIYILYIT